MTRMYRLVAWCLNNLMVLFVAGWGLLCVWIFYWFSSHPMHDESEERWLLLLAGLGFFVFLLVHLRQLKREMGRHAAAKQALTDANRALLLLEQCHKLVNQEKQEVALLAQACNLLVEVGGYRFAWCGLVGKEPMQVINPVASNTLDEPLLQSLRETWHHSGHRQEPAGTAIRTRLPVQLNDLLAGAMTTPWHEQARLYGYASSLALPLLERETPFAVLSLYAQDPHPFHNGEIALLTELSQTLVFGLLAIRESKRRKKAEKELALHRHFLEEQVTKRTRVLNTVAVIAQRLLFHGGWKHNIDAVLMDLGMAANVSRAFLALAEEGDALAPIRMTLGNEWVSANREGRTPAPGLTPFSFPGWRERLLAGQPLIGRTQDFPEGERADLADRGILSLAMVPILVHDTLWGVLGFEDCQRERTWSSGEIEAMRLAANTLDAAVRKDRLIMEKRAGEEKILKLSTAVEQSPNIVLITDALGRIEYVNQQYTKITGHGAAEVLGTTPLMLQPQAKSRQEHASMWQSLTAGQPWREEMESVRRDGTSYWVQASLAPLVNETGEITHFVCIQED
ncbi:MAG: GAF domain-containing protein, partial [Magnetococcales bacterium]|nr:GAF domain-containing protein [Magnetococcales bacterium]